MSADILIKPTTHFEIWFASHKGLGVKPVDDCRMTVILAKLVQAFVCGCVLLTPKS